MSRKALIIGVNDYEHIGSLNWCENDAISIDQVLTKNADGSPNFSAQLLTTNNRNKITHSLVYEKIQELFSGEADVAVFFFAGHGGFNENMSEGIICLQNYSQNHEGFIRISDILHIANESKIKNKIIILDSCQSGAAGNDRNIKNDSSVIGDGITILTACAKEEYAMENSVDRHGLFTSLLIEGLTGGASNILGQVTPGSLYSFIDSALGPWDQRPIFKTNVSRFVCLRKNIPLVDPSILRELPNFFKDPTDIFPLDPSFEPDRKNIPENLRHLPQNINNEEIFKKLQKCNRHGLVVPHEVEHMYDAAIESTGCKLTAFGAYYRKLSLKGYI
ncbi:caspase family protein [Psychrobacter sp. 28M-43]|uniref:caspase family protein n=1 Tax=Psychrobacter sp. 28M-43 TaxID=2772254 RepID=UPI00168D57B8|nr:caspase family protein [Psychrobacter sp. 28M-43]QOD13701.1 caspase family protein [Psychrobacter sp. 28M-43]